MRDFRYFRNPTKAKDFEETTNGAFRQGHPIYGNTQENGSYQAEGQATHGPGTSKNPSLPLDSTDMWGGQPQRHIPFPTPQKIATSDLMPPVEGSETYLNKSLIKKALDALAAPKENNFDKNVH